MGLKVSINGGKFFEVDTLTIRVPGDDAINCTELEMTEKGMGETTFHNDEVGEILKENYVSWGEVKP